VCRVFTLTPNISRKECSRVSINTEMKTEGANLCCYITLQWQENDRDFAAMGMIERAIEQDQPNGGPFFYPVRRV